MVQKDVTTTAWMRGDDRSLIHVERDKAREQKSNTGVGHAGGAMDGRMDGGWAPHEESEQALMNCGEASFKA